MTRCNRATITTIATMGTIISLNVTGTIGFAPSASNRGNFGIFVPQTQSVPIAPTQQLSMAVLDDPNDRDFDWDSNERRRMDSNAASTSASSSTNTNTGTTDTDTSRSNKAMKFPNGASPILPIEDEEIDFSSQPPLSKERTERIEREKQARSRFIHGDELVDLRKYMHNLRADLIDAREKQDTTRIRDLTSALHESQNMDAEQVYLTALKNAESAERNGHLDEAKEYHEEAMLARQCLPQFQLGGLWVGKYGDHGYEMVNVTYVGDTLVATKITGDQNVPKGEITFTADLHPKEASTEEEDLEPIELSDVAAKQWGHKYLPRYVGQGQAADDGFINSQWMDGQLILVGEYFSFAWIPLGHQIFFGRPSAELTLKMLKQSKMSDFGAVDQGSPNPLAEMRAFAQRCFEETELMLFDDDADGELCFLTDDENYFCQEGCFE